MVAASHGRLRVFSAKVAVRLDYHYWDARVLPCYIRSVLVKRRLPLITDFILLKEGRMGR